MFWSILAYFGKFFTLKVTLRFYRLFRFIREGEVRISEGIFANEKMGSAALRLELPAMPARGELSLLFLNDLPYPFSPLQCHSVLECLSRNQQTFQNTVLTATRY